MNMINLKAVRRINEEALSRFDQKHIDSYPLNSTINANTDIFPNYTVPYDCVVRIIGAFDTAVILKYTLKRDTTIIEVNLNDGNTVSVSASYVFDIPFKEGDIINFQVSAGCTILHCDIYSIRVV